MTFSRRTAVFLDEFVQSLGDPDDGPEVDPTAVEISRLVRSLLMERSAPRPGNGVAKSCALARDLGRQRAERGGELEPLLRTVRAAGREAWREIRAAPDGLAQADVPDLGALLWEVVDQISEHLTTGFHASAEARLRADEQRRTELWEGLLHGMAVDPAFALEAVRTLELAGPPYVAIEVEDGRPLDVDGVVTSSSWLQRHSGAIGLVTVAEDEYDALVHRAGKSADRPVGVSSPVDAECRLEQAFAQAGQAVRTRVGVPGVTAFAQALPEALLQASPEITEHLVLTWLGRLLELPAEERDELIDTLRAWVDSGCSASAAATALYCHRNTVLNRMRRITGLLGRELSAPAPIELVLALRAVARLRPG